MHLTSLNVARSRISRSTRKKNEIVNKENTIKSTMKLFKKRDKWLFVHKYVTS